MGEYIEGTKNKWIAILYAVLLHAAVALSLFLIHTYQAEKKQKKEYGMEVSYGTDDMGMSINEIPIETVRQDDVEELISEEEHEKAEEDVILKEKQKKAEADKNKKETLKTNETNTSKKTKVESDVKSEGKKQGDDKVDDGNKGKVTGTDVKNVYTTPGGIGTSLELTGWDWEAAPKIKDNSTESGKIVFQILVDDKGQVISITVLESTISSSVEKLYEKEVLKTRFYPSKDNTTPTPVSKGKISFLIRIK